MFKRAPKITNTNKPDSPRAYPDRVPEAVGTEIVKFTGKKTSSTGGVGLAPLGQHTRLFKLIQKNDDTYSI